jgi:hypothetical protein
MALKSRDLIIEYYEKEKDKYSNLDFSHFEEIASTPWKMVKEEMQNNNFLNVRLKYFGVFKVYKKRVEFMLKNIKERFNNNKLSETEYNELKNKLDKYINEN